MSWSSGSIVNGPVVIFKDGPEGWLCRFGDIEVIRFEVAFLAFLNPLFNIPGTKTTVRGSNTFTVLAILGYLALKCLKKRALILPFPFPGRGMNSSVAAAVPSSVWGADELGVRVPGRSPLDNGASWEEESSSTVDSCLWWKSELGGTGEGERLKDCGSVSSISPIYKIKARQIREWNIKKAGKITIWT